MARRCRTKVDASKTAPKVRLEIGREYVVSKYWPGTFKARLLDISEMGTYLHFLVTDAMRPGPLIEDKCPFPECVLKDSHPGDHAFADFRNGLELTIRYSHITLVLCASTEQTKAA